MVPCIVLAVPSSRGKGVLVSPTIYGNVMVGPTSENLEDRTATGTSEEGFEFLVSKGRALMPSLFDEEITATYAGLRAAIDHDDYLIDVDARARYLLVGGIRSTGLTSGMAIAEYVTGLLDDAGLDVTERPDLPAAADDAEPRRRLPAAVSGCRTHRRRSRIRPHRLLLRAGHRGRDPRCVRLPRPARRSRWTSPSHPGDERSLPRLLLRWADHHGALDANGAFDDRATCGGRDRRRRAVGPDRRGRARRSRSTARCSSSNAKPRRAESHATATIPATECATSSGSSQDRPTPSGSRPWRPTQARRWKPRPWSPTGLANGGCRSPRRGGCAPSRRMPWFWRQVRGSGHGPRGWCQATGPTASTRPGNCRTSCICTIRRSAPAH